jgi:hypothetical protein
MNSSQITKKLLAEGCSPANFVVNGHGSDVHCLCESGGIWAVFYTERGVDEPPIFSSRSEEEACQFFYDLIMGMEHWHLVGLYKDKSAAEAMESQLASIGIEAIRNDIPALHTRNDPRYRVFVVGKNIFRFRQAFGEPQLAYA